MKNSNSKLYCDINYYEIYFGKIKREKMVKPITYNDIENSIVKFFDMRKNIIIPNCYIAYGVKHNHECDLLIIRPTGYAFEVEIKMSKSDLIADFNKKHGHINDKLKYLYFALPEDIYESCLELIPEHAGILVIRRRLNVCKCYEVKKPKQKPCRKLTINEQLKYAKLGVMRVWKLKKKLTSI